jgi:ATP phosphoribosyltransferase regulatory subunit
MQTKDVPALRELARRVPERARKAFVALPELYGEADVLRRAARQLPPYPEIKAALRDLNALCEQLRSAAHIRCFDLAELRGYHYHTGVVFAAYTQGRADALALGGRYDEIGKAFGRARPATGFSMDLREAAAASNPARAKSRVLAPHIPGDAQLQRRIAALRAHGGVVVVDLPGHAAARAELGCDRALVRRGGKWVVEKVVPPKSVLKRRAV